MLQLEDVLVVGHHKNDSYIEETRAREGGGNMCFIGIDVMLI